MNIPNILTIVRFILIPLFALSLLNGQYIAAACIFIAAGLTDVLDGYIARRYDMITSWGKLADPAADKFMVITALTVLTIQGKIHIAVIVIMVAKEIMMGIGSLIIYRNNRRIQSAGWFGKLATVVFYCAIVLIILGSPYAGTLISLAVAAALFAFARYLMIYVSLSRGGD